jgi:hypothetical protein
MTFEHFFSATFEQYLMELMVRRFHGVSISNSEALRTTRLYKLVPASTGK